MFAPLLDGGTTHLAAFGMRLLILLLAGGAVFEAVRAGQFTLPRPPIVLIVVAFLAAATLVALCVADYQNPSLQWFFVFVGYVIVLWSFLKTLSTWQRIKGFMWTLVGIGCLESIVALYQGVNGMARPRGTFFNPNFLAGYLAAIATYFFGYVLFAGRLTRSLRRIPAALPVILLFGATIVWTGSRAGIIVFLVGIGTVAFLRWGRAAAAGMLTVVLLLVVVPLPGIDRIKVEHAQNPMSYARWDIWKSSVALVAEHPFGVGLGLFQYVYPRHAVPVEGGIARYGQTAQTAHNEYLQMAVELGAAGTGLFLFGLTLVAADARTVLRSRLHRGARGLVVGAAAAAMTIVLHAAVDSNLHEPPIALMLVFCVSVVIVAAMFAGRHRSAWTVSIDSKRWAGVLGAVFLILATVATVRLAGAWLFYERGNQALLHQDVHRALDQYRRAITLDPGKSLYHSASAAAHFELFKANSQRADVDKALEELAVAERLNPLDGRLPALRGYIAAFLAAQPATVRADALHWWREAAEAGQRALAHEPFNAFRYWDLARAEAALGHHDKAVALIRYAIELEPNFLGARAWLLTDGLASGGHGDARAEYEVLRQRHTQFRDWHKESFETALLTVDMERVQRQLLAAGIVP